MEMKALTTLVAMFVATASFSAENSVVGKWSDKSDPAAYSFEFAKGQDFIYIHRWTYQGQEKSEKAVGVWELGAWEITSPNGSKSSCNLTIYADTKQCCFETKFIASNLVLTSKYTNPYGASMCENRVLVRSE